MADSSTPYFYGAGQTSAIRASLSEPRFASYLSRGGNDEEYAFALYLYNARLAKAFLFPLHIVEVAMRNAMDAMLVARHGPDWPRESAFRSGVLTAPGRQSLDKAVDRAGHAAAVRGGIVAELTFDFWSNLLRPEYGGMWRSALNTVFPNIERGTSRHHVQVLAKGVNRLRNRVLITNPSSTSTFPRSSLRSTSCCRSSRRRRPPGCAIIRHWLPC